MDDTRLLGLRWGTMVERSAFKFKGNCPLTMWGEEEASMSYVTGLSPPSTTYNIQHFTLLSAFFPKAAF
jgi:hypothetical protein